ncbi:GNAT family N-acetyltransferase [Paenibacillus gansuensis]|uniref:GNAT family N-acetyltransferase n=1 Tax=Paenibacillus gansuensis TaxID=306542 RepID=A0ABW5PL62_9BACL
MLKRIDLNDRLAVNELWYLQHASYKVEAELIGFSQIPPLLDTLDTLQNCGEQVIAYEADGEMAGALAYTTEGRTAEICRMMVHPDYFRQEIASKLLEYVEDNSGCSHFIVSTGTLNEPAIRLYRKHGFQETGRTEVVPGVWITHFSKSITERG